MRTMEMRKSAPTEIRAHVTHPSFQEAGAAEAYASWPKDGDSLASRNYMPDDVTRDCARRMHYAAYRAERALSGHAANRWRQRYYAWRDRIILGNRKLIYSAVSRRLPGSPATEDLIGECHLVMIRAVAAYNPWLGIRFSTYACTCLYRALGRLGRRLAAGWLCTSLDLETVAEPPSPQQESDESPPRWPLVVRHLGDEESVLSQREKRILEHRFGLSGKCIPSTLDQLAADLGISKERVRQLQSGALGKLREVLLASASSS